MIGPGLVEWLCGTFQPKDEARRVNGADEVRSTVAVHIHDCTVNTITRWCCGVEHYLFPIRSNVKKGFPFCIRNDVDLAIPRKIGRDRRSICGAAHYHVSLPVRRAFTPECRRCGHGRCADQGRDCEQSAENGRYGYCHD